VRSHAGYRISPVKFLLLKNGTLKLDSRLSNLSKKRTLSDFALIRNQEKPYTLLAMANRDCKKTAIDRVESGKINEANS
jgi:hypothetical protein